MLEVELIKLKHILSVDIIIVSIKDDIIYTNTCTHKPPPTSTKEIIHIFNFTEVYFM